MCDSFDEGYGSDGRRSPSTSTVIESGEIIFKEKYGIERLMSKSANGIIYSGRRRTDGKPCVAKQIPRDKIGRLVNHNGRMIPLEFHLHLKASEANVPGIVAAWECFERKSSWVLVMERPTNSLDLFDVLGQYGTLNSQATKKIIAQVIQTCVYLAVSDIFHRDIKDENIMLNLATLETKVIDFGCGDTVRPAYHEFAGTVQFTPPEVHLGHYCHEPVTVWSIGALTFTLLIGDTPYDTIDDVLSRRLKRPDWKQSLGESEVDFIEKCMSANPVHRPKLRQLRNHRFFD